MHLKVIACEIAARELYFTAATCRNLVDLELLTQGHHDRPVPGRAAIQERIDAVPEGKYDAIVLGYGLCSRLLDGLVARHTKLIAPRAHDCITLFLGSAERYALRFSEKPGTYYYTSGWIECAQRRGLKFSDWAGAATPAGMPAAPYEEWVRKYGEDQARYLVEEMGRWTAAYTEGTLIRFDFDHTLGLENHVRPLCQARGWEYNEIPGDLTLLQRLLDGQWDEFLTVLPGQRIAATHDDRVIEARPDHVL